MFFLLRIGFWLGVVCVLLSSGYAEPGVLAGVSGAPVAAFLGKPFTLPDLQARLGVALAQTAGAPHRS